MRSKFTYYSRNASYSRSANAEAAEDDGRLPMTRAIAEVRARTGCPAKVARAALEAVYDGEWHHVGKYAARVKYYDTAMAENRVWESGWMPKHTTPAEAWQWAREAWMRMEDDRISREIEIGESDRRIAERMAAMDPASNASIIRRAEEAVKKADRQAARDRQRAVDRLADSGAWPDLRIARSGLAVNLDPEHRWHRAAHRLSYLRKKMDASAAWRRLV